MLLSDHVPLRSSTELNGFLQGAYLPWVYGNLTDSPQSLVQLSDTLFIFADGAARVKGVQIAGQDTLGFDSYVGSDKTGNTVTFIELAAPLNNGLQITATGTGYVNSKNGSLLENPGDVLEDVFKRCRYTINDRIRAGLFRLREESAAEGLTIGGRVSARETLRATINEIMRSCGGGWSTDSFWLHPSPQALQPPPTNMENRLPDAKIGRPVADARNVFSRVSIEFDDQSYQAKHRQAIKLAVTPCYDDEAREYRLLAPWIRNQQSALAVARRLLRRASGRVFEVVVDAPRADPPIAVGDVLAADVPDSPEPGLQWLTVIAASRLGARAALTCELFLPHPQSKFNVVSRTIASSPTQLEAFEISNEGGTQKITVYGQDRKPVSGARVSIDGAPPIVSDSQGQVKFVAAAGEHIAYIEMPGKLPVEVPFTL